MTGKEKLEKLTHGWYGFAVFNGVASILMNGIGILSIIGAAIGTVIGFIITFVIGRMLANKSSLTRIVLVVFSAIGTLLGVLGVCGSVYTFVGEWSFSVLAYGVYAAAGAYMYARSFNVLTDRSVKAHFG